VDGQANALRETAGSAREEKAGAGLTHSKTDQYLESILLEQTLVVK